MEHVHETDFDRPQTPFEGPTTDNTEWSEHSHRVLKGAVTSIIGLIISFLLYYFLPYDEVTRKGLALLVFIAILWLTEAVHITITAFAVPVLGVLIGMPMPKGGELVPITLKKAMEGFASPTIYLFFGGFALATALHVNQLDRKIAFAVIRAAKSNLFLAVLGIFGVTALLSAGISNTATAAMMLPLALGLVDNLPDDEHKRPTTVFILLGVAYSANIGGMATIVGSPPNAIAGTALGMDFATWMKYGIPLVVILLPATIALLYFLWHPKLGKSDEDSLSLQTIPWTMPRIITIVIFVITAGLWIFSSKIRALTGLPITDAFIAVAAAITIVSLGAARWKEVSENTDWGVLLLFGGGISLSNMLKDSGVSLTLGQQIAESFGGAAPVIIFLIVAAFIVFLTEFTSNTASAALLVPVFGTIAVQTGLPEESLVLIIGFGASCAFMLPVATPPNAIVVGSGQVSSKEMLRTGIWLNILCIVILTIFALIFWQ